MSQLQKIKQKRLGQHFSGMRVARLLAALSHPHSDSRVIDPMSGRGDMLQACIDLGVASTNVIGVEIDPVAYKSHCNVLGEEISVLSNAFDPELTYTLYHEKWDLVITNPPYVRYQNQKTNLELEVDIPNAQQVRDNLQAILAAHPNLDEEDRKLFVKIAKSYSGLADLAVPSWLLCASLVSIGGRLSVVMPESWLSRDYAAIIQYVLLRWFELEYVVEDRDAAWFNDAQIRTALIVAKRVKRKDSAFSSESNAHYIKIVLPSSVSNQESLVGKLEKINGDEIAFSKEISNWLTSRDKHPELSIEATLLSPESIKTNLLHQVKDKEWFRHVENPQAEFVSKNALCFPDELKAWISNKTEFQCDLTTLEALGISVGQGLRTGANKFFYLSSVNENGRTTTVTPHKSIDFPLFPVPKKLVYPVVRKQSELPSTLLLEASELTGRVLLIQELITKVSQSLPSTETKQLHRFIRYFETVNFGSEKTPKRIVDFTAVASNIRTGNPSKGIEPRAWYMLPELQERHKPDLFIPRVVNHSPRIYFNKDRQAIIDANFTTLWLNSGLQISAYAVLALLNSSLCKVILETSCSVMGGGALKIEATHIRRIPIPHLGVEDWGLLASFGEQLAYSQKPDTRKLVLQIDIIVLKAILNRRPTFEDIQELRAIEKKLRFRRKNKRTRTAGRY